MLTELEVRDLGPIHHALINPAVGMTAITGETGAGKSMLLSALGLIRGMKADAERVSAGATHAWAQGIFTVDDSHPALEDAAQAGAESEDNQIFLTRQVAGKEQGGRSRAIVNGHSVPRSLMTSLANSLITIHGQADQQRLVSSAHQREFLDQYGQAGEQLAAYREVWKNYQDAQATLKQLTSDQAQLRQREDYLRDSLEQINKIDPQPHEDEELKAQRTRIENSARIRSAFVTALSCIDPSCVDANDENSCSAVDQVARAQSAIEQISEIPGMNEVVDQLSAVSDQLSDIVSTLANGLETSEGSDADLDSINSRIHELAGLTRRWGPEIDDVLTWKKNAQEELDSIDSSPERIAQVSAECEKLAQQASKLAHGLHETRSCAAKRLSDQVNQELESLAMSGAHLNIQVSETAERGKLNSTGWDDITFLFSAFPSAPERPLAKSASGGELSRLMLALELSFATSQRTNLGQYAGEDDELLPADPNRQPQLTFVFDEVDAGVGGSAAVELGKRLASLAKTAQVIVVTHLAQVASWADAQFVVSKNTQWADQQAQGTRETASKPGQSDQQNQTDKAAEALTQTTVTRVEGQQRLEEIARMLSGSADEISLQHADQLLKASKLERRA